MQINGKPITDDNKLKNLSLYITELGSYQSIGYEYIVSKLTPEDTSDVDKIDALGYIQLQRPLEALNMIYPSPKLLEYIEDPDEVKIDAQKNSSEKQD